MILQSQTRALWPYSTELTTSSSMLSESFCLAWTSQMRALRQRSILLNLIIPSIKVIAGMLGVRKVIHLRSSETETSFEPLEDHSMRKIEPSCPMSLNILTALHCWWRSFTYFECEPTFEWSSSRLVRRGATYRDSTFQTIICESTDYS